MESEVPLPYWADAARERLDTDEARSFLCGPEAIIRERTITEWVARCRYVDGGEEALAGSASTPSSWKT